MLARRPPSSSECEHFPTQTSQTSSSATAAVDTGRQVSSDGAQTSRGVSAKRQRRASLSHADVSELNRILFEAYVSQTLLRFLPTSLLFAANSGSTDAAQSVSGVESAALEVFECSVATHVAAQVDAGEQRNCAPGGTVHSMMPTTASSTGTSSLEIQIPIASVIERAASLVSNLLGGIGDVILGFGQTLEYEAKRNGDNPFSNELDGTGARLFLPAKARHFRSFDSFEQFKHTVPSQTFRTPRRLTSITYPEPRIRRKETCKPISGRSSPRLRAASFSTSHVHLPIMSTAADDIVASLVLDNLEADLSAAMDARMAMPPSLRRRDSLSFGSGASGWEMDTVDLASTTSPSVGYLEEREEEEDLALRGSVDVSNDPSDGLGPGRSGNLLNVPQDHESEEEEVVIDSTDLDEFVMV
ncbi:hypothetical protein BC830DRAFT_866751 [Chytriomyces sp. MP71]|nr:hypothetical protein BC830DRAFT_866751 [Chytriomyces sp. MP71]